MTSFLASSVALVSLATTQGLLSGVYWGLGPAVGTALFGYLLDVIGMTISFYALSLICLVYLLIFLVWNRVSESFISPPPLQSPTSPFPHLSLTSPFPHLSLPPLVHSKRLFLWQQLF